MSEAALVDELVRGRNQPRNRAIIAAHIRLRQMEEEHRKFDWTGEMYGLPVGRPEQQIPEGLDWLNWLYMAGRGSGKTRSAAEASRSLIKRGYSRGGFIGATAGDVRDIMVEGESGLLAVCHSRDEDINGNRIGRPRYLPSKRRIVWETGASISLYSAEEPDRLRGPQHEFTWCDELASWQRMRETWDMMRFGLRLGKRCICLITTTPRPLKLMKEIISGKHGMTKMTRSSTYANRANLSDSFFQSVVGTYEGTSLGRQELHGDLLEEVEGALWRRDWIDKNRLVGDRDKLPEMKCVCVSVDPAVTATEESDETGIIVNGLDEHDKGWVLADKSGKHSPAAWAKLAIDLYHEWDADFIIAEANNGGDLVINNIRIVNPDVPVRKVIARKGKFLRAEPVANFYEQGRVSHFNQLDELEDQLCSWEPLGKMASPDRLDAMVHGLTKLMVKAQTATRLALPVSERAVSPF